MRTSRLFIFLSTAVLLFCLPSGARDHATKPGQDAVPVNPVIFHAALASSGEQPEDGFGDVVAVDGNTVVVGAEGVTVGQNRTGAAYVFVKPANGWMNMTQVATLTPSDDAFHFGYSAAVSGDTIVIGAPWTEVNGNVQQGAVYVFVKPANGWSDMTETAKLTGSHVDAGGQDHVGNSVSIHGNTIVVGVPGTIPNPPALA